MKKIIKLFFLFSLIGLISFSIILSTIGIHTKRFNNLIVQKINETNNNINLKLDKIKFKLDIKVLSLFLETNNPKLFYSETLIPAKNIKVYIDFLSIIKTEPKIDKIKLTLNQINIKQLKQLTSFLKPSNLTSFINNNIFQGKFNTEIDVYFDENNILDNFIARGDAKELEFEISSELKFKKTDFSFFADRTDILVTNFYSESRVSKIRDGDLKLSLNPEIFLESNFKLDLDYSNLSKNYPSFLKKYEFLENISKLNLNSTNNFTINFDKTYKVKKYELKSNGKISAANFNFKNSLDNKILNKKINSISLINSEFKTNFNSLNNVTNVSGNYFFNKEKNLPFKLENFTFGKNVNFKLDFDYEGLIKIPFINYEKKDGKVGNIIIDFQKSKNQIFLKDINFNEGKSSIIIKGLRLKNKKFLSLEKILVSTYNKDIENNNFKISISKKILINGTQFDASNLPNSLNKTKDNFFSNISKDIEIDLNNIKVPLSEKLQNFKLIGSIKNGKFIKISSKGDFGNNNFLDISMKNDKITNKKYLEIYSDITKPLLTEFNFFKGLTGGKLLYSAIIDNNSSNSKLKIENFKVVNAPGMIKLLSLADLSGLADLAEGDGITFDILEISMEKIKDNLTLNEILALGPSMSVLMEGYQNANVTSLRGTLVPAKTLNKMISKIPVIGDIIIPKEVGEGLFGISFKIKGPPGKMKTTINPIRTITPRFIQKIIEKSKTN